MTIELASTTQPWGHRIAASARATYDATTGRVQPVAESSPMPVGPFRVLCEVAGDGAYTHLVEAADGTYLAKLSPLEHFPPRRSQRAV